MENDSTGTATATGEQNKGDGEKDDNKIQHLNLKVTEINNYKTK